MLRAANYAMIATAAAVGAAARLTVSETLEPGWFATSVVNLVACLAAGLIMRSSVSSDPLRRVVTAGLLGGLSTFATLSEDLRRLASTGDTGPLILAFAAAAIGCPAVFLIARGRPRG